MIRVQLWRGNKLLTEKKVGDMEDAYRVIDMMINAIHKGRRGQGDFRIAADWLTENGEFDGSLFLRDVKYPNTETLH